MAERFDVGAVRGRWRDVLFALGADEKTLSGKHCPCPFCGGKDRFRFTDNGGNGMWICNSCGAGNGMQFVQSLLNVDFVGAIHAVERVLPTAKARPVVAPPDPRPRLNALWSKASPLEAGDPVVTYLEARGVWCDDALELRCATDVPYYHEGREIGRFDAMLARVRDVNGSPKTLHCTYLKGGKKADVPSPKKVLSPMGEGPAIRLYPAGEILAVAEGIETALAVRRRTGMPVWATISANGMKSLVVPPEVKLVEIFADNDGNFVGQVAAYALAQRLVANRVFANVALPAGGFGRDFADAGAWD